MLGVLRGPNRLATAPCEVGVTAPSPPGRASMKKWEGSWQVAHACPAGWDSVVSEKRSSPRWIMLKPVHCACGSDESSGCPATCAPVQATRGSAARRRISEDFMASPWDESWADLGAEGWGRRPRLGTKP